MNLDFTFLTAEQIFGDNKLKIFEHYGTKAAITDFAILLGGFVSDNYYYNSSNSLENRTGIYWTSSGKVIVARVVHNDGTRYNGVVDERSGGARPALPYSSIRNISSNKMRGRDGILEVEYGQYPQKVASQKLQEKLESEYIFNQEALKKTGKTYTIDSRRYNEYDKEFSAQGIDEFEYAGKKYVRVKANSFFDGKEFILSNGEKYKDRDYVWVEVEPIKWLVDEENDIAISERILFAGVQFNHEKKYKGDFENTDIKNFMDECFSKEIIVNSNQISHELISENEEVFTNVTNIQPEIVNQNMSIDDVINETLFKMNEILGEENQKIFTKVKK